MAHVATEDVHTAVALMPAGTPLIWPSESEPQQRAALEAVTAQLCRAPAATETAGPKAWGT